MYLLKQLFQYLNEYYFSAVLGSYDNFDIESVTAPAAILGGLCLGMFLSSLLIVIQKKHIGKMARALLSLEAHDEKNAKTLSELGLSKSVFIKMSLSSPSVLRKLVTVVEGEEVFTYFDELSAAYPEYKEKIEGGKEGNGKKTKAPSPRRRFRLRKLNFETARFFIAPEAKERAFFHFKEKGNGWRTVLLSFVIFTALFFISLRLLPVLVKMLDSSISNFKGL